MMHGADQAMAKIAAALRGSTLDEVERLAGVIDFLTPEARFDLDDPRVATLQRAIRQQRVVRLRYHSFARDETTERDVEPHRLIYSDGTWYLSGNCRLRRESRSFRLSRIEELTTLTETFEVPSELAGGITAERVEVRVRVDARAAR